MTTSTVVKFDGGARPNPGPAAIGYIVEGDGWTEKGHDHIGESTNNRAEYHALIQGLEVASEKGCNEIVVRGDSEVIVKQVRGEYGVNEPELRPLRNRVLELAEDFKSFEIQHVSRSENREADELVELGFQTDTGST
jgi:ribonuclease HI